MNKLADLNRKNDVPVRSVSDDAFRPYGRILSGCDCEALIRYLDERTPIPAEGNVYVASDPEMEALPVSAEFAAAFYGGTAIEIGYCNGRNSAYNGFEYHKGSEINVCATDLCLALGHVWDIRRLCGETDPEAEGAASPGGRTRCGSVLPAYDGGLAEVFFAPRGTVLELYATTLHFSPLRVTDEGFRDAIILPRGTNTPLSAEELEIRDEAVRRGDPEAKLLFQRNKWLLAHPEREPLMKKGAYPGLLGPNRELRY